MTAGRKCKFSYKSRLKFFLKNCWKSLQKPLKSIIKWNYILYSISFFKKPFLDLFSKKCQWNPLKYFCFYILSTTGWTFLISQCDLDMMSVLNNLINKNCVNIEPLQSLSSICVSIYLYLVYKHDWFLCIS